MCARYTWNLKVKVIFLSKLLSAGLSLCICSDGFREFMHVSATRCIGYKRMCIFHELPVSHATTIKKISPSLLLWKQSSCLFVMCAVFPFLYHFPIHLSPFIAYFPSSLTFFPELCVCVCIKWRVVQKQTVWWPHQQPIGLSVAAGGLKPMGEAGRWCSRRKDAAAWKPQRVPCENSAL